MKNILFIVSHLGSGYENLIYSLNKNERIDIKSLQLSYAHPEVLEYLYESGHKLDNSASFYGDLILFNKNFSCNSFYKFSKFIFFINSPLISLNEICKTDKLNEKAAFRYYSFRLRRIYEMAVNSNNNFVFITHDDLINKTKFDVIEKYLNLKSKLTYPELETNQSQNFISSDLLIQANDCYEKYLFLMKSI